MREEDFIPLSKDLDEQAEHDRSSAFRWFVLGGALTLTAILLMSCTADSIINRSRNPLYCFILFIVHQFRLAKLRKTARKSSRQSQEIGCRG